MRRRSVPATVKGTDPVAAERVTLTLASWRVGAAAVARGEQSPQEAAAALQSGLSQWLKPAQTCRQEPRVLMMSEN